MTRTRTFLKDEYPSVAAQWHPTRNIGLTDGTKANRPLTAENAGVSQPIHVWWRCQVGHEWQEAINVRRGSQRWKSNIDDCPECETGPVRFACGHEYVVRGLSQVASNGVSVEDCYDCSRPYGQIRKLFHEEWEQHEGEHRAAAADWLDRELPTGPPGLPASIYSAWRHWAEGSLARQYAYSSVAEGDRTVIEVDLRRWRMNRQAYFSAVNSCHPVHPFPMSRRGRDGSSVWPNPSLFGLPVNQPAPVWRAWAEQTLAQVLVRCASRLAAAGEAQTAKATQILTEEIRDFLNRVNDPTGRPVRRVVYTELSVAHVPTGAVRFGRSDVALMWRNNPSVLVEIDHMHNQGSVEKLNFVASEGGIGLWIRWDDWSQSRMFLDN